MKNTNFTKTIAALLVVFAAVFAASAQQTFKVGDKVEWTTSDGTVKYTGVITKDEGGGYYSGTIDPPAPMTGNTFFRSAEMLRPYKAPAQQQFAPQSNPTDNDSARTQASSDESSSDCKDNDWSSWGVYKEMEFMQSAREKYSTGFTISTKDLICMVKTRKVSFRLTQAEEDELNKLRDSPELIEAIRENIVGGAEKSKSKGGTGNVAVGRYACGVMSGIAGNMRFQARPDIFIMGGGSYKNLSSTGAFFYDAATQRIVWKSGALSGINVTGGYEPGIITLYNAKGQILYSCTLAK